MAQVPFQELLPEVLSVAAACPMPTVVRNMRNAAIELAQKAECMRWELEGDLAIADIAEAELSVPQDMVFMHPVSLRYDGANIRPHSVRMLDVDIPGWRHDRGTPTHWIKQQNSMRSVRLYPIPSATGSITGEIVVKPSRDALGLEEVFMDRFMTHIIDGTLGRLLAIPSAPWFDGRLAQYHKSEFISMLDDARRIADADNIPKLRRVKYGGS
jgi:hypothetical protein